MLFSDNFQYEVNIVDGDSYNDGGSYNQSPFTFNDKYEMSSNGLASIVNHVVENSPQYWNAHFAAVLQCLHYHTTLNYSPRLLEKYPLWSLADLRAEHKSNFFGELRSSMANWGFQYFLVNYLNSPLGNSVTQALIRGMEEVYAIQFRQDMVYKSCWISGKDTAMLNSDILSRLSTFPCVGSRTYVNDYKYEIWENSDFALVLNNDPNVITNDAVGIFGEVEGNPKNGKKLLSTKFWERKHPNCLLGVGVVSGKTSATQLGMSNKLYAANHFNSPAISLNYVKVGNGGAYKIVVLIESEHPIVKDFMDTLSFFEMLFWHGHNVHVFNQFPQYFKDAALLIQWGYRTPVLQLLQQFAFNHDESLILDANGGVLSKILAINR